MIYVDPTGNVISLSGLSQDQEETLSYLQQLTDYTFYTLSIDDDGNVLINKDIVLAVRYESGNKLIERLINSSYSINIEIAGESKGNTYSANDYDDSEDPNVGCGGTVHFNPLSDIKIKTTDLNSGYVSMKKRPSYIGLSHELIHADRASRGYNLRNKKSFHIYKSWMDYDKTVLSGMFSLFSDFSFRGRTVPKEELATVGLKYNTKDDITENDIRIEHRLEPRGAY